VDLTDVVISVQLIHSTYKDKLILLVS